MTVNDLIDELWSMPRDADVSIAIDDPKDRCNISQVACITCGGVSEVLICETDIFKEHQ